MLLRKLRHLAFPHPLDVRRLPDGTVTQGAASRPFRRRGRENVFVRLETADGTAYALALNSEDPTWRWPYDGAATIVVMLYRANADGRAWSELRRLTSVQRRDALYKAELVCRVG